MWKEMEPRKRSGAACGFPSCGPLLLSSPGPSPSQRPSGPSPPCRLAPSPPSLSRPLSRARLLPQPGSPPPEPRWGQSPAPARFAGDGDRLLFFRLRLWLIHLLSLHVVLLHLRLVPVNESPRGRHLGGCSHALLLRRHIDGMLRRFHL